MSYNLINNHVIANYSWKNVDGFIILNFFVEVVVHLHNSIG